MFGRRRCKVAETLSEKHFDLAFQVIYEFNLPGNEHLLDTILISIFCIKSSCFCSALVNVQFFVSCKWIRTWYSWSYIVDVSAVDIYAGVAASLAERKKGSQLTEFLRNIKGTIDEDDWDQVKITSICYAHDLLHVWNSSLKLFHRRTIKVLIA